MAGVESYYLSIRNLFPYCRMVFAYGSAAFQQYGVPLVLTHAVYMVRFSRHLFVAFQGKMLDLIFVVDDPCSWHKANLEMNSQHYSCLRYIGPKAVSFVQELPACVYFNPLITVQGQVLSSLKCALHSTITVFASPPPPPHCTHPWYAQHCLATYRVSSIRGFFCISSSFHNE